MALGAKHVEVPFIELGQLSTLLYFSYFVVIVPATSLVENTFVDLNQKGFYFNSKIGSKE
jgi:ubiquinol-cytochrome c reductase cytochrome b subunit